MIVTESYRVREDGTLLVRTYSDADRLIRRDGVLYEEAVDPFGSGRVYEESDEPIWVSAEEALAELREVIG